MATIPNKGHGEGVTAFNVVDLCTGYKVVKIYFDDSGIIMPVECLKQAIAEWMDKHKDGYTLPLRKEKS